PPVLGGRDLHLVTVRGAHAHFAVDVADANPLGGRSALAEGEGVARRLSSLRRGGSGGEQGNSEDQQGQLPHRRLLFDFEHRYRRRLRVLSPLNATALIRVGPPPTSTLV